MATATKKPSLGVPFHSVFSGAKPSPNRNRRRLWLLGIVLLAGVLLVGLLPTMIAHSFLFHWIVGYLAADFQGRIVIGRASLGWFRPIQLQQIELRDAQEASLGVIGRFTSDRTLWQFLWNRQDLGRFVLEETTLHVQLRPDGSNWEDALARYLSQTEPSRSSVNVEVELKNGTALLSDARSGRSWRLENLQAAITVPPLPSQPRRLLCTGQVISPGQPLPDTVEGRQAEGGALPAPSGSAQSGAFQFEFTWGGSPSQSAPASSLENTSSGGIFFIQGDQLPLGLAEAILMRWEPLLHLEGRGSGWLEYGWGAWAGQTLAGRPASLDAADGSRLASDASQVSPTVSPTVSTPRSADATNGDAAVPPAVPSLPSDAVVIRANISSQQADVVWSRCLAETLSLRPLELRGEIIWTNEYLQFEDFQVHCQAGEWTAVGRLDLRSEATDWMAALRRHPYQMHGRLDLAQLARLLPQTLRIQEGIEVTSGLVELALSARLGAEGMVWQARLATNDLQALHQGRPIAWPEPIRLSLDAHEGPKGLVLESLQCISEFLRVDAFGTAEGMSISAQMDLDRLTQRLKQWVDLGEVQLAGKGAASLTWTTKSEDRFEADLMVQGDRLRVVIPQWSVQMNEDIRARAIAAGKMSVAAPTDRPTGQTDASSVAGDGSNVSLATVPNVPSTNLARYTISRLDSATLALQLGQDRGEIRLRQPVQAPSLNTRWPVEVRLEGQLADWVRRLKPWLDISSWQPNGQYALAASLDLSSENVQIHEARMAAAPFHITALGLQVAEPRMDLTLSGRWDWNAGQIELAQARLQANPFVLEAQNVRLERLASAEANSASPKEAGSASPSGMKLTGRLQAQGALEQLQRWFSPTSLSGWSMSGGFTAQAEFQTDGSGTDGVGSLTIRNLSYTASPGSTPWRQAEVRLTAQGHYDHQTGLLQLASTSLQGDGIGYTGKAQMTPPTQPGPPNAVSTYQAIGQVQYDWQKLTPLLRSYWGNGILLQGRGTEQFRWQGPLDLALAEGAFGVGWQALEVYGFRGGPAALRGQLSRGWLQIAPVEMTLSEGKLQVAGSVRLAPSPAELVVQKGSAARQVRISPAMCASVFQYIAPVLADVTTVEGRVSLLLDACRVPLSNPGASQIQGRLVIHSIQIGPSPLVRELALLLTKEPTARLRNEAVIPFTMANGRVYHEGLELIFPEITIRTQGYVGLDQSLALTAEMPILPKWTAMNPRLATVMKGQTIRLPIRGTLRRPQLDQQTLRRYTAQFLQKSAENLLQDELQRQLDRLIKPPSP